MSCLDVAGDATARTNVYLFNNLMLLTKIAVKSEKRFG